MPLTRLTQHPDRIALSNELHARPFPVVTAPGRAACLALERDPRDDRADRDCLIRLLSHYGAPHPPPGANHLTTQLGNVTLRWERHTEFVTYTLHSSAPEKQPFSGKLFDTLPDTWLAEAPGRLLTSILVRIDACTSVADATDRLRSVAGDWFVPESLAAALVLDDEAIIAGDFRLDPAGHIRFAVLSTGDTAPDRLGRIVQRLVEIETYKSMSMLTLPIARDVFARLDELDRDMGRVVAEMTDGLPDHQAELDRLLQLSAKVERFSADTAYRFTASEAYSALVHQRVTVLRENRVAGMQLFSEFMMRRFEPAMRTCRAAQRRLADISDRTTRASRLLSTRVTVETNLQNKQLLEKMDRRAALQLRLQETVEGLSVVAISYYTLNLLAKLLIPLAAGVGIGEKWVYSGLVLPVVGLVWMLVRRIRHLAQRRADGV